MCRLLQELEYYSDDVVLMHAAMLVKRVSNVVVVEFYAHPTSLTTSSSSRASYHDNLIKEVQGSSPELRVLPAAMVYPPFNCMPVAFNCMPVAFNCMPVAFNCMPVACPSS